MISIKYNILIHSLTTEMGEGKGEQNAEGRGRRFNYKGEEFYQYSQILHVFIQFIE